uniref:LAMP family protein lmp-1 n=1 Tax=Steinernema glaseri TaxID=37863 RepID=A0A1I8AS97_9BILA
MRTLLFLTILSFSATVFGASEMYALQNPDTLRYCFLMDVDFEGTIQYLTKENTTHEYSFNVTKAFPDADGNCTDLYNSSLAANFVVIKFHPNDVAPPVPESQKYWELALTFVDRAEKSEIELVDYKLTAYFYASIFKDAAESDKPTVYTKEPSAENTVHWAKADKVYKAFSCSSSGVSFENNSKLALNNLKVTAFANLAEKKFPTNMDFEKCPKDIRTSDIVPIVVGACLAGLVIIVLVAYLIGRARAKRQGYASV